MKFCTDIDGPQRTNPTDFGQGCQLSLTLSGSVSCSHATKANVTPNHATTEASFTFNTVSHGASRITSLMR